MARNTTPAQVRKQFDRELDKLDALSLDIVKEGVEATYRAIMSDWPLDTGYSGSNNRLNINGSKSFRVSPAERPTEHHALVTAITQTLDEGLAKLDRLRGMQDINRIVIGNNVEYARDVGNEKDNGLRIYQSAVRAGEAAIRNAQRSRRS